MPSLKTNKLEKNEITKKIDYLYDLVSGSVKEYERMREMRG